MGLIYAPSLYINVYYFNKFLGRANGITQTGVAVGIFVMPPLLHVLIDMYGWRGSLLVVAAVLANSVVCGALFRPHRLERKSRKSKSEETHNNSRSEKAFSATFTNTILSALTAFDFKLLRHVHFLILLAVYFQIAYSYAIVLLYLPSRATSSGISDLRAASLVSALGIGSLIGRITHGLLIDHNILSTSVLTALSLLVCGIVSLLNPVSDNYWILAALSAVAGLTSGVYMAIFPILAKEYVGVGNVSGGIGWINVMQGFGSLLALYGTGT